MELQDNPLRDLNNARNLSRTPETDNLARGNHVVPTEWAEQLERERNEARAELIELQALELNNEGACVRLKKERDEAREALEGARGKAKLIAAEMLVKLKDMEAERDYARTKATNAWEAYTKLDTENRRLERKLEELRLAYNEAVAEPPLKFKRIT